MRPERGEPRGPGLAVDTFLSPPPPPPPPPTPPAEAPGSRVLVRADGSIRAVTHSINYYDKSWREDAPGGCVEQLPRAETLQSLGQLR